MLNVFISSTTQDLERFRDEARKWVRNFQLNDIAMERWGANPNPPIAVVREALEHSDVFVGIFAWRYGSLVDGKKSYIEYEHELACELGKSRLIFLADEDGEWPVKHIDRDATRIWGFRSGIETPGDITHKRFKDLDGFRTALSVSLFETLRSTPGYGSLSPEKKAAIRIANLINGDLAFRDSRDEAAKAARQWFISAVPRCNLGERYIPRSGTSGEFAHWLLTHPTPYLVLTGTSGVGKTNFLLAHVEHIIRETAPGGLRNRRVVLYLPLGCYFSPGERLCDTLVRYFAKHGGGMDLIRAETFRSLIKTGDALVILDGLDEMVRNHGEEACGKLVAALQEEVDPAHSTIVLACRDHIYLRLLTRGLVPSNTTVVPVRPLNGEALESAIASRFTAPARRVLSRVPALKEFASNPLLLEMMTRMDARSWQRLADEPRRARLYELWSDEIIIHCASNDEVLYQDQLAVVNAKLGRIATLMLEKRSDLVKASDLAAEGLPMEKLESVNRESLSILVRQTKDEWGFVHDSFREYALARLVANDLESNEHTHLSSLKDLDYVGAETYCFLDEMFADRVTLLTRIETAMNATMPDEGRRNNLLRNCFEAIGMVGGRTAERFIPVALKMLAQTEQPQLFPRTQHNIVRCLERLHRSAPQPYFEHVIKQDWPKKPTSRCFGAAAVRGFHQRERSVGYSHPMVHLSDANDGGNPYQEEVSICLVSLIQNAPLESRDATELIANCTFALIRWLHHREIDLIKGLIRNGRFDSRSKGNLFLSFLRAEDSSLFVGATDLFAGMELSRVAISQRQVSEDFKFNSVTFHRCRDFLDFPDNKFSNCSFF